MSLDDAAHLIAERLKKQDFIEIYANNDADGIAGGSILCHSLFRVGKQFRFRVVNTISKEDLKRDQQPLLCDFGSSVGDLPDETIVVDHHIPHFRGIYHINPRLFGMNGESELSAAGIAYLIGQQIGDNRDLIGLVLVGILSDKQEIAGKNREIINEGIANGFISPKQGPLLPGRDLFEQLAFAVDPYLSGISGNEGLCRSIIQACTDGSDVVLDALISRIILEMSPHATIRAMRAVYGTKYCMERECIEDAHTLVALIDACGRMGMGGLASSLCLRSSGGIDEAWGVMKRYRTLIIDAIQTMKPVDGETSWFEIPEPLVASGVANAISQDVIIDRPVIVFSRDAKEYYISLRAPQPLQINLESLVRELVIECNGRGSGHERRAQATISVQNIECFKKGLKKALAA